MSAEPSTTPSPVITPDRPRRRGVALAAIVLAQLTVVLDGTIVAVALPQMQDSLGLAVDQRQWVVTIYALTFGALLLLGGRISDVWGRKRTFIIGMSGFVLASALGGLANEAVLLLAARAGQGLFAALLAPAALAALTVAYPAGAGRAKAFALFGAVSAGGAAVGLIMGGILTDFFDWRWCFLVNVPIGVVVVGLGLRGLVESRHEGRRELDFPGAVAVAAGLGLLVYGLSLAEENASPLVMWSALAAAAIALAVFVVIERRSRHPLLPLAIPAERTRATSFIGMLVTGAVMVGGTLQITLYLQTVLGFSPLLGGLGVLPMAAGVAVAGVLLGRILPRVGPRITVAVASVVAAAGFGGLSLVSADTAYVAGVLPWLLVSGVGVGGMIIPLQSTALLGVTSHHAGAASATAAATQQVGGAIGTTVIAAVAAAAASSGTDADGYGGAFGLLAGLLAVYALVSAIFLRSRRVTT